MTHDELLAKIDKIEEDACWYQQSDGRCDDMHDVIRAFRAVVELHRPEEQDHKQYKKCWNCNLVYPCPTVQSIEKELG
jgi:hypothetical protein